MFLSVEEKDVHEFVESDKIVDGSNSDASDDDTFVEMSRGIDTWYECYDNAGNRYYYNERTKQSEWVSPEWVEETDDQSGARFLFATYKVFSSRKLITIIHRYYVHLRREDANPLASTWSKPKQFSRIIKGGK